MTTIETAHQDDPDDPSSASVKKTVAISHASRAVFETHLAGNDIDLFVLQGRRDRRLVRRRQRVTNASSSSCPPDGTYEVWVHGFGVTGTPSFELTMNIVQGTDLTVSGLPAGGAAGGHARHDPRRPTRRR